MMPWYFELLIIYFMAGASSLVASSSPVRMFGSLRVQYVAIWFALSSLRVSDPLNLPIITVILSYLFTVLITLLSPIHLQVLRALVLLSASDKFFIRNS